jgi:hypothetical protein
MLAIDRRLEELPKDLSFCVQPCVLGRHMIIGMEEGLSF